MIFKIENIDGRAGLQLLGDGQFLCSSGGKTVMPDRHTKHWLEAAMRTAYEEGRRDKAQEIRIALGVNRK